MSEDFKRAAEDEDTCTNCKHCQINKKVRNVRAGYLCMKESNKQMGYYSQTWMEVSAGFLCNKFALDEK